MPSRLDSSSLAIQSAMVKLLSVGSRLPDFAFPVAFSCHLNISLISLQASLLRVPRLMCYCASHLISLDGYCTPGLVQVGELQAYASMGADKHHS